MGCLVPIAWVAGEVAALAWLVGRFGPLPVIAVLLAKALVAGRALTWVARRMRPDFHGAAVLFGLFLCTWPAPLATLLGLLLVLPPTRHLVARLFRARLEAAVRQGGVTFVRFGGEGGPGGVHDDGVIDVEATTREPESEPPNKLGDGT